MRVRGLHFFRFLKIVKKISMKDYIQKDFYEKFLWKISKCVQKDFFKKISTKNFYEKFLKIVKKISMKNF